MIWKWHSSKAALDEIWINYKHRKQLWSTPNFPLNYAIFGSHWLLVTHPCCLCLRVCVFFWSSPWHVHIIAITNIQQHTAFNRVIRAAYSYINRMADQHREMQTEKNIRSIVCRSEAAWVVHNSSGICNSVPRNYKSKEPYIDIIPNKIFHKWLLAKKKKTNNHSHSHTLYGFW